MATPKRQYDNTVAEEIAAIGERAKGAIKETVGAIIGNDKLEREGQEENIAGRQRQENNQVLPDSCAYNAESEKHNA